MQKYQFKIQSIFFLNKAMQIDKVIRTIIEFENQQQKIQIHKPLRYLLRGFWIFFQLLKDPTMTKS